MRKAATIPAVIEKPQLQQHQDQHESPQVADDILAAAFDFAAIDQYAVSRVPTETPKRTINKSAGATATKRQRTIPELKHLTLEQYQSIVDAKMDFSKLRDIDAAWKSLDWAYGAYEKNVCDINTPPDVVRLMMVDHSKEPAGMQTTSAYEQWLMLVLLNLGVGNVHFRKRNIFLSLTGRSVNAYAMLLKRLKM